MKIAGKSLTFNGKNIYHEGNKPVASDILFTDGKTLQQKLDDGSLKGEKGDTGTFDSETIFNSLNTSNKTIIGAINELLNLINKDNNGEETIIPVEGVTVDDWNIALTVGQTRQMIASIIPSNATNQTVYWYSDYPSVATVNETGLITAMSSGYAKISVTTDDGGFRYDVHVNVSEKVVEPDPEPEQPPTPNPDNSMTVDSSYTIKPTEMLEISYTTSVNIPSSCAWELRQNGTYLVSAYRDTGTGKVVCYTGNLSIGTHDNITLIAKEYQTDGYVDIAISNTFSITVESSSGDSGEGQPTTYTVTTNYSNCYGSNSNTSVTSGSSYQCNIYANDGYIMNYINVTMNGVDVTSSVVNQYYVNIQSVTGDIVITARADKNNQDSSSASITTSSNTYTMAVGTDTLRVPVTISGTLPSYPVWEVRQNGNYFLYCYRDGDAININASSLGVGTYDNLTIVAKDYVGDKYVDVAISNAFSIIVNSSSSEGGGGETQPPNTSNGIILNSTSHTINMGEMLTLSATINIDSSYAVFELRQNGAYLVSAYRSGSDIVCYTGGLNAGTYSNLTAVAKTMENSVYVDIAESQPFTLTVNSNSSGGGETTPPDNGGSTPPNNGGGTDSYDDSILSYMYPMPQSHECIPSGAPSDWKYQSRWENKDKPAGWSAFGGWAQVYRVDGTPFTQNTGVEIKDYKVYGWKNGQWHSVVEMPYPSGNFYAEDFTDDANKYFPNGIKPSDDRRSIIIRLTSDMTVSTSKGTKNVCYHPFTAQLDYDANFEYIFTCVSMRKVKWDANGVDDMNTTRYCASCGGDWWRQKGLTWAPDWSNNKGIAQPKITEVTSDWKVFAMTTVPQGWSNGFPK